MSGSKLMYEERKANISAFRGCDFDCIYCSFKKQAHRGMYGGSRCKNFEPHNHLEVLERKPPKTKEGEFLSVCLNGDISFADPTIIQYILVWCRAHADRTFFIQTKNPLALLKFSHIFKENLILGTTIETNRSEGYSDISKAPLPIDRVRAMYEFTMHNRFVPYDRLRTRVAITIEPIMDFDLEELVSFIKLLEPEFVWVGYNSRSDIKLPEPSLEKTLNLIKKLRDNKIEVREKLLRKAWWEED